MSRRVREAGQGGQLRLPVNYTLLTPAQRRRVREEYVRRQSGNCFWCGAALGGPPSELRKVDRRLFPTGFFAHPVHLQHSHRTGMTEGAVHAHCNAVMWQHHKR